MRTVLHQAWTVTTILLAMPLALAWIAIQGLFALCGDHEPGNWWYVGDNE